MYLFGDVEVRCFNSDEILELPTYVDLKEINALDAVKLAHIIKEGLLVIEGDTFNVVWDENESAYVEYDESMMKDDDGYVYCIDECTFIDDSLIEMSLDEIEGEDIEAAILYLTYKLNK